MCLSGLCQQLMWIAPIPNLQIPRELQSFSGGGPHLNSAAALCIHYGPLLVVVCTGFSFPFSHFQADWGRNTWKGSGVLSRPLSIILGFLPSWLKVKWNAIVLIHIQIILSLLICTICFVLSFPCLWQGVFNVKPCRSQFFSSLPFSSFSSLCALRATGWLVPCPSFCSTAWCAGQSTEDSDCSGPWVSGGTAPRRGRQPAVRTGGAVGRGGTWTVQASPIPGTISGEKEQNSVPLSC